MNPAETETVEGDDVSASTIAPARRGCFSFMFQIVLLLTATLLVATYLGRYFFLAEVISNFRAQLATGLLVLALPLWLLRLRFLAGVAAILGVIGLSSILSVYLPSQNSAEGDQKIKFMSFNVLGVNQNFDQVASVIEKESPDILLVMEYSNHWTEAFKYFHQQYPYRQTEPRWHGYGIALFSKLPLVEAETKQLTSEITDNPALFSKVQVGAKQVRIVGLHTFSPTNSFRLDLRNSQFSEVARLLRSNNDPLIVVGDFNAAPWSSYVQEFLSETKTRDSRQGFGFQASWHASYWPLRIPIDHAFVSEEIGIHDRRISDAAGSDHFSMIFEFSVKGP